MPVVAACRARSACHSQGISTRLMSSQTDSWSETSPFSLRYLMSGVRREYRPSAVYVWNLTASAPASAATSMRRSAVGEIAVVVGAGLGDDVAGVPRTDRAGRRSGTQGCRRRARSRIRRRTCRPSTGVGHDAADEELACG